MFLLTFLLSAGTRPGCMSCSRTSQGRWWGPAPSGRSMSGRCSSTTLTRTMDCRAEAWASTTGTSCTWQMPVTTSGGRWGRSNVSGKGWAVKSNSIDLRNDLFTLDCWGMRALTIIDWQFLIWIFTPGSEIVAKWGGGGARNHSLQAKVGAENKMQKPNSEMERRKWKVLD